MVGMPKVTDGIADESPSAERPGRWFFAEDEWRFSMIWP